MIREDRNSDTMLSKSGEVTGRAKNTAVVAGERRGKDDRKKIHW
jgi:hypothetical protein